MSNRIRLTTILINLPGTVGWFLDSASVASVSDLDGVVSTEGNKEDLSAEKAEETEKGRKKKCVTHIMFLYTDLESCNWKYCTYVTGNIGKTFIWCCMEYPWILSTFHTTDNQLQRSIMGWLILHSLLWYSKLNPWRRWSKSNDFSPGSCRALKVQLHVVVLACSTHVVKLAQCSF